MTKLFGVMFILVLVVAAVGCSDGSTPDETAEQLVPETSTPTTVASVPDQSTELETAESDETADKDGTVPSEVSAETPETIDNQEDQSPAQPMPSVETIQPAQTTQPEVSLPSTSTMGTIEVLVMDAPPEYEITRIDVIISGVEVHQAVAEQDQDQDQDGDGEQVKNKDKEKGNSQGKGNNDDVQQGATPDDGSIDGSDAVVEEDSDETQDNAGWISLDIDGTFDLLKVQGIPSVLGESYLGSGKYTQIRVAVESVIVYYLDGTSSGTQTVEADVPSGKLKFVRPFNIEAGKTTSLLFDFIADKSVIFTGSDKVIFKPVIKLDVFEPVFEPVSTLSITTTSLPEGTVDEYYSALLEASGGTEPYAWTWSGTLPGGLGLDAANGVISGTPTAAGDFTFTVQANDSDSQSDTQSFDISISSAMSPVEITTTSLPDGKEGVGYMTTLEADGGVTPYTWTWSGTMPGGLGLDTVTGTMSGTPTAADDYSFTVRVDDSDSQSDTQELSISIGAAVSPLEITTTSLSNGEEGAGYATTLEATGGIMPYVWSWSGTLPGGLDLDAATGIISGTSTAAGDFSFAVRVDDSDSQSDAEDLSIHIIMQ